MAVARSTHPLFLCAAIGIAALCATMADALAQSARELDARLHKRSADYVTTVSEATTAGLVAGATIGGVIGSSVVRDSGLGGLAGTVIGGAIGSMIGNGIGTNVADQKEEYARREDGLDRSIAQLRAGNSKLASLVEISTQLVAVRKAEFEQLNQVPDAGARRSLATDLAAEVGSLDQALAAANKTRNTLRANIANYQGNEPPALTAEMKRTNGQLAALQARRNELDRMRKSL
uniref:17 kDa surface antigen n=1 Tax=Rhodopseudomonas palustris (strain BisA53) TaxID=316055 RepID=Q07JF7_RHOP5